MKTALLLSGGMDSIAIAYWKRPCLAITIDYGHAAAPGEIRAAIAVTDALRIPHKVIKADISAVGSGDLAGVSPHSSAPATEWWPYRNQFLLTVAAMHCLNEGASELLIGALRTDGFHADGTTEFIAAFNALLELQEGELSVRAPAIGFSAAELVRESNIPRELLSWSHSCHKSEFACGNCRGCWKHQDTTQELYGEAY